MFCKANLICIGLPNVYDFPVYTMVVLSYDVDGALHLYIFALKLCSLFCTVKSTGQLSLLPSADGE